MKYLFSHKTNIVFYDGFLEYLIDWVELFMECKIRRVRLRAV